MVIRQTAQSVKSGAKNGSSGHGRPEDALLVDTLIDQGRRVFRTYDARAVARQRGGPSPHPFAIATALVEPSAISHWSALAHQGLTEQIPDVVTVSIPTDIVVPPVRRAALRSDEPGRTYIVDGLAVRYVRIEPGRFWSFDEVQIDARTSVRIADRERAILEAFVALGLLGSIGEVLGVLAAHLLELDVERLVSYALRYGQDAAIKRLGFTLEQLGVDSGMIRPLRRAPIHGDRWLDPRGPACGPRIAGWHLLDNLNGVPGDGKSQARPVCRRHPPR